MKSQEQIEREYWAKNRAENAKRDAAHKSPNGIEYNDEHGEAIRRASTKALLSDLAHYRKLGAGEHISAILRELERRRGGDRNTDFNMGRDTDFNEGL